MDGRLDRLEGPEPILELELLRALLSHPIGVGAGPEFRGAGGPGHQSLGRAVIKSYKIDGLYDNFDDVKQTNVGSRIDSDQKMQA